MQTAKQQNSSWLAQFGPRLLEQGYSIVPIKPGYKFPKGLSGWEQIKASTGLLNNWLSNGFAQGGVGVLTKDTPAVDIDVQDTGITAQLISWCEEHIGPTVQRVGLAPKTLLVYRTDESFTKVTSKTYEDMFGLVHRVEILGDGQQFVAFAVHPDTGEPYQWTTDDTLADIDQNSLPTITADQARALVEYFESIVPDDWEVVEKEGQAGRLTNDGLTPDERVLMNVKPKVNVSVKRLSLCLEELDADDYHLWVKVGMALYHQFDGDSTGLDLWDTWSQKSDKYDPHSIPAKWQTFEANLTRQEPITAATLLRLARIADEQAQGDVVGTFIEQYVYVQDGDRLCDLKKPPHCSVSRLNEFKNRTANIRHEIPAPTAKEPDKTKLEPVWKSWLVHPQRLSAEGTVYIPKGGQVITDDYGLDWINEFHMPEFLETSANDNLGVFFDHMDYLFPVDVEREWFISWMAFNLQYPERRCKVVPLHVSVEHGTGRGWVVELLGKLLGQWNCTKTKMDTLSGEGNAGAYQDYLDKSLVCAIEEVKESNKRFSVSDKIRDRITEPYLEVNLKYGGKKTQQVFTNFFFMSNHPDALVLTTQDRRINVFENSHKPKSETYYDQLYAWLESDGVVQLYNFLMTRDLSGFNWKRSMDTEARTRMIHNNRTETEVLFWELMGCPPYPAMTLQQIIREMRKLSDKDEFDIEIEEGQLTKLLQHHAKQTEVKIEGKKQRPWILIETENMDNKAIRESVKRCNG